MPIEVVDYSYLLGRPNLRDGTGDFEMKVTYPKGVRPPMRFVRGEFLTHKERLTRVPVGTMSFIIGTFTAFYDPELRRLPDEYKDLIDSVHQTLESAGMFTYSCFRREAYGEKSMRSGYATVLDGLALRRSRFLTMLPGASISAGTWKEINEAMKKGIDLVGLFRESDPEFEFREKIMESAAAHGAKSKLIFITSDSQVGLNSHLAEVTKDLLTRKAA